MKKFELTAEYATNIFGKKLFRIKALVAFGDVKEGDLGGFIEKNLTSIMTVMHRSPVMHRSTVIWTMQRLEVLEVSSGQLHFSGKRTER